jgi:hypothetical protein
VSGGFIRLPAETPDTTQIVNGEKIREITQSVQSVMQTKGTAVVGVFHQQHLNLQHISEYKNL